MQDITPPETMVTIPKGESFDPTSEEAELDVLELAGDLGDRCQKIGGCALNIGMGTNEDGSVFIGSFCEPAGENDSFEGCTVKEDGEDNIEEQIVAITKTT